MKKSILARLCFSLVLFVFYTHTAIGQTTLNVHFDTITFSGLPGLHSFAAAQYEDKWLLIGGRKDGLHPKNGGFHTGSANQHIYVVQPSSGQVWQRALAELPDTLREQLHSANMEFCQWSDLLLFAGGYGRSEVIQDHRTYPYLTLIDVPELVSAVIDDTPLMPCFQQVRDTFFAVTGGQLQVMNDTFYLVGGHRFEGLYSSNAGTNNIQFYTDGIRKFTLEPDSLGWRPQRQSEIKDELNLHRRDYNLIPQIFASGEAGLVAFSGVFQPGLALLPFLNIIEISPEGHAPVNDFSQFLANYHCAKVPLYAEAENSMHTLFFGGMSQYYLNENDSLIKDNRIPFVRTASRVSRLPDGTYEEVGFDAELPFYTGSSAEFLLAHNIPVFSEGIVQLDELADGETLLGYIVGGIVTAPDQPNPFINNVANQTTASTRIIRVFLQKNVPSASPDLPLNGRTGLGMAVFPNPTSDVWNIQLTLPRNGDLMLVLQNAQGQIVWQHKYGQFSAGASKLRLQAEAYPPGWYWLTANVDGVFVETKRIAIIR
ncbi:MAG TPA: T9SS C-terminal target domain-containing protein [Saprospiraceae bacterium]|nr:T9SS C-terminal target domain-containing protein [Saprospiraceae bacterium]HMQ82923.1 T9SS C-terminal target domain-containing protein [Saprospiraceae bacterium]